jgi:hypothetical protein
VLGEAIDALRHSSGETVRFILESLRAGSADADTVDEAFGPEPSKEAFAEAVAWNVSVGVERRRKLIEGSLSRDAAARRLGVSPQAVSDMLDRGDLIGLKHGREWRLPEWQFDADSPRGLVPGLREVVAAFPASVVALSRWIERENPDLQGLSPRAALQKGNASDVLRLVRAL